MQAVAGYAKVFRKMREGNLTHPEIFVTHSTPRARQPPLRPTQALASGRRWLNLTCRSPRR
eukprot:scaffold2321_cov329-Prasinococcus_capsulatus_cf.AAC.8